MPGMGTTAAALAPRLDAMCSLPQEMAPCELCLFVIGTELN